MFSLIANFLGAFLSRVLFVLVAPLYLALLGRGAIGLLGVYSTLLSMAAIFYHGLGRSAVRTAATWRGSLSTANASREGDALRTLELCGWILAALIGLLLAATHTVLADSWLTTTEVASPTVRHSVLLMAALMLFQIPQVIYYNALLGFERHVIANTIQASFDLARWGGPAMLFQVLHPDIEVFFVWQTVVVAVQTGTFAFATWGIAPNTGSRRATKAALHALRPFIFGVGAITVLSTLLTQFDRVILSRMLALEAFGAYVLVLNLARAVPMVVATVSNVFVPRLCAAMPTDDGGLRQTYHMYAQAVTVVVIPASLMAIACPDAVLRIYLHDPQLAASMSDVFRLLVAAMAISALWEVPYMLQLSAGWTGLALRLLFGIVVVCGPLMYALTIWRGMLGAALAWLVLSFTLTAIGVTATHRRLLRDELMRWLRSDVVLPTAVAAIVALAFAMAIAPGAGLWTQAILLVAGAMMGTLCAAGASSTLRPLLKQRIANARRHLRFMR